MTNDFYCSQKFWWLTVDLEKQETQSCCAAVPARVDIKWLDANPGQLFNTPAAINERKMMLEGKPVASCEKQCWIPESQGLTSRRLTMGSNERTHESVVSDPSVLNVVVGTDCNLTCVYCCKQYSSAWSQDIYNNGDYSLPGNRYNFSARDRVIMQISQKDFGRSANYTQLLNEVVELVKKSTLNTVIITGGEPFLYLELTALAQRLNEYGVLIKIFSSLGVNEKRFEKEIEKLKGLNVEIVISNENVEDAYEFVRYGNTWERLNKNISTIEKYNIKYSFYSVVSNLTVMGIHKFIDWAGDRSIMFAPCSDPDYLSPSVLDPNTKQIILNQLDRYPEQLKQIIEKDLIVDPTELQHQQLKIYLKEFAQRRNLGFSIFGDSFQKWIA
jgi:organic radical activating enzyme